MKTSSKGNEYVLYILEQIRQQGTNDKPTISDNFRNHFQRSNSTFNEHWLIAKERYNKELQAIQTKKAAIYKDSMIESFRNGLFDKYDKLKALQDEIKACQVDLKTVEKISDKVSLRKTIQLLMSEMSKIDGDYAPVKGDIISNEKSMSGTQKITFEQLTKGVRKD